MSSNMARNYNKFYEVRFKVYNINMKIGKILKELLKENENTLNKLVEFLQVKDAQIIYAWMREESNPTLDNLAKLADFFNCSIEYLLGRTEEFGNSDYKKPGNFYNRLVKVMKERGVSQYRIREDKICSAGNFNRWKNYNMEPQVETLIKLADYLGVSVDYLVGRE